MAEYLSYHHIIRVLRVIDQAFLHSNLCARFSAEMAAYFDTVVNYFVERQALRKT